MKILIIDDDKFLLDMYSLKFTENKFEVVTAVDGVDALDHRFGNLVGRETVRRDRRRHLGSGEPMQILFGHGVSFAGGVMLSG